MNRKTEETSHKDKTKRWLSFPQSGTMFPYSIIHNLSGAFSLCFPWSVLISKYRGRPATGLFLFTKPNKRRGSILTLVQQHLHNVRITLPGGSVQSGVPEFILKHKTSASLTSISFDIVKLRCVIALKFQLMITCGGHSTDSWTQREFSWKNLLLCCSYTDVRNVGVWII